MIQKVRSPAYLRAKLSQPLAAKDRGPLLHTIQDVIDYIAALPRERETHPYWQRATEAVVDKAEVAEVGRRIQLALFFDGRFDLTRIEPVFSAVHKVRRRSGGEGVKRVRLKPGLQIICAKPSTRDGRPTRRTRT